MLTESQRDEFDRRGVVRLPSLVDPDTAAAVAASVWDHLGRRGIHRRDPSTWPSGFVSKLQGLRAAGVYRPFVADRLAEIGDQVLGAGAWSHHGSPQALVSFPEPGPWRLPHRGWHADLPARGASDPPGALRLLGIVEPVRAGGGATLVVEGSHELTGQMVDRSPDHDAGGSADVRRRLRRRHEWFRALTVEGSDREPLLQGEVVDGVAVRVRELTGEGGDAYLMHPWTMHAMGPNVGGGIRSMLTHTMYRTGNVYFQPA